MNTDGTMMHVQHKTRVRKPYYICAHCTTSVPRPQPWLNFCLIAEDDTEEAKFVFIGKQTEYLLGCSVQYLLNQPKKKEESLPPKFNELINKKYLFTVQWGRNKFRQNCINYQVINSAPVPPTTTQQPPLPTTKETISPNLSTTPTSPYEKSSFQSRSKLPATLDTRKQLFVEEPSKRPQTSGDTSKAKAKEE